MKFTRTAAVLALTASSILLAGCGLGGMGGPYPGVPELRPAGSADLRGRPEWIPPSSGGAQKVAAPQVAYRIDENRYFEIVPKTEGACYFADLYYTDKAKGIHSFIYDWKPGYNLRTDFIIDAANDQYLIAPVTQGNTDCSSGGGGCGGARLPYSTDAGRTWKRADALSPSDGMSVSGSIAYEIDQDRLVNSLDLSGDRFEMRDWKYMQKFAPPLRKAPLDTKFHCSAKGKE
ncbi:hypothetical protein WKW80_19750 [Variovorax humicola]|uniref:Tli3-like domain-containing protein n=1 Tax=Variovorax humicola TaxID=1769758 RepID=A0ABU8W4S8_9BURK